jgi:uncharacterized protein (TIGR00369 family)
MATDDAVTAWQAVPPEDRTGQAYLDWANGHPVSAAIGLLCTEVGPDHVVCELPRILLANPNGSVHGGIVAAILDQALAYASLTAMPAGSLPNTTNIQVQYLRPAMAPLRIRANVTKGGRSLVFTRAEVHDRDGRLCATGDGTFVVLDGDVARAPR